MNVGAIRFFCLIACGMLSLSGAASAASIVFNDLGPTNPVYDAGTGWTVSGASSAAGTPFTTANPFTPSGNFILSEIDVAIGNVSGTNSAVITLNADNSGLPGTVLESWSLTSLPAFGSCCTLGALLAVVNVNLVSGAQYWIVAAPGASDTWDAWNLNNIGATGNVRQLSNGSWSGGGANTLGAFEVFGTGAVPEPATFLLSGCGLGLLLLGARKTSACKRPGSVADSIDDYQSG